MDEICVSFQEFLAPKLLVLAGSDVVLLLRLMEEREGEDGDSCCDPDVQESSCQETSVFAMGSSRNLSFCDESWLSGRIGKALASAWSVRLVSDQIDPV